MPKHLVLQDVSKSYGLNTALHGASLELGSGEVLGLVGENGAGKSTLVKVLAGRNAPYGGEVIVAGERVDLSSPRDSAAAGFAVLDQELSILPNLTVAENVALGHPSAPAWWSDRKLAAFASPALEAVGLGEIDLNAFAGDLPIATQQLVELARILARNAKIIVLDEPTAALSDDGIQQVKDAVRRLSARGCIVIYVSHRLQEVLELCDQVAVVRDSTVASVESTGSLNVNDIVERMLGRRASDLFPKRPTLVDSRPYCEIRQLQGPGIPEPVSLSIAPGQIVGLAGQTGSGVSEFLEQVAGRKVAFAGEVVLGGQRVKLGSASRSVRFGIGYVSPDRKLDGIFARRTSLENVTAAVLPAVSPRGLISDSRERKLGGRLAAMVNFLGNKLPQPAGALSGGNQQKVVLGRWFAGDTRLLIVDEPTRGVDIGARAEIYQAIRRLTENGTCVLFASSDVHEVIGLADVVLTFYRGRVVGTHRAEDADERTIMTEITHADG